MNWTVGQIAELLNGTLSGDAQAVIEKIAPLDVADDSSISFLANPKYEQHIYLTKARVVLVSQDFYPTKPLSTSLLKVEDPYIAFTCLQEEFMRITSQQKIGLEQPFFLGDQSTHGKGVYIGAFSYIGSHVKIGDNVKIYPQVHIGDYTAIGDNSIIYPGVKIYHHTTIGKYCIIQAGAVLGSHGFGFAPEGNGSYRKIPQTGTVTLGDHVDIGANTTIDCATLGTTLIESGVKIDNLVQIAHNVKIGQHTVIAAQTGISGSTTVGKNVMIGGQVGTVGHIDIADQTKVGARSGVTKSTKSHQVLFGVPAMDRNNYLKSYVVYKKLPEMMRRIEELERKALTLKVDKDLK